MRLAEGPVPLGAALMGLGLLALLASVHCVQDRPSWRYSSSEVVIPKKELGHGKGLQLPGRLSYSLRFGGQRHVIHLWRKNLFWPGHLPVMTQDDQGALQIDNPYIPADCFYLGHLEEIPFSMVTIDTCHGGLEGIMKLDDLAYEIAPLKNSPRFEHTVSHIVADINATGPTYKPGHKEDVNPPLSKESLGVAPRLSSRTYASHTAFIRGQSQIGFEVYRSFNNISESVWYAVRFFHLVDTLLRGIDFRYYIYLLTIYTENDPSRDDFRVPGGVFHNYFVHNFHRPIYPHTSTVILKNGPHESTWIPVVNSICDYRSLVFVSQLNRHMLLLTIINTSQQARMYGVLYDEEEGNCVCQRRATCIMSRYPQLTDSFSNCSIAMVMFKFAVSFHVGCYFNTDRIRFNESLTVQRCGNGIRDGQELCDCGSFKQCYSDECCTANCDFTPGSICNSGECCSKCQYAPKGILCRPSKNICDLPEYCNGTYTRCPEDFYLQNGTPCSEEGYCYSGNCTDRTVQCRQIFGPNAHDAPEACYRINVNQGFRFGHCLRRKTTIIYTACTENNKMCGRLQCANITHLPKFQDHTAFHQSVISGYTCFGLDEHRAMGITDIGHVRVGTPCAPGLYCVNSTCSQNITDLNYDCVPEKCSFRGLCNNRKNCHCHKGWSPPLCLKKGSGGSVDSGPRPIISTRKVKQSTDVVEYLKVICGRVYCIFMALLLGVAMNAKYIKSEVKEEKKN